MNIKTLLIAAGICGFAASSQAQLVAWYKFDEGAAAPTAFNSVSGGTNGTVSATGTGSVTTGVAGVSGNAYQFTLGSTANTGGFVDMGNANFFSSINTSGQLTLSAWVNTTTTTGNRNVVVFAGSDLATQTYVDLGYSGTGSGAVAPAGAGSAYTRIRPNNIGSGPGVTGAWSDGPVNDGEWNHLAMTVNLSLSPQVTLYVNGVLESTITLTAPNNVFPTFNNFEIGRLGRGAPVDYFSGLIDDVQVYDAALTASQVEWLFDNPGEALTVVPEPTEVSLAIAAGLGLLAFMRRRNRRAARI